MNIFQVKLSLDGWAQASAKWLPGERKYVASKKSFYYPTTKRYYFGFFLDSSRQHPSQGEITTQWE